ncbi:MAG: hypothetical protein K2W93_14510 [Burkholderiaceae bacterium]|nr:hypothetical protein [Burkholderiaceae bacterium]
MNAPSSAREALLVEALGDVAVLLDRIEKVGPVLASTADAIVLATTRLEAQAATMEARMATLAAHTQAQAVKHIARRTGELLHSAAEAESQSMAAFARALLHAELNPALRSLVQSAQACAANSGNLAGSGRTMWWACAATATGSSILTWALATLAQTP